MGFNSTFKGLIKFEWLKNFSNPVQNEIPLQHCRNCQDATHRRKGMAQLTAVLLQVFLTIAINEWTKLRLFIMAYVYSPIEWRTEPECLYRKNNWLQVVIVEILRSAT